MNTWSCCCASFCVTCLEPEEGGWLSPHTLSKWESRRALAHGSIGAFWRHDFCVLALTFRTAHLFSNCGIAHSHEFFFFFAVYFNVDVSSIGKVARMWEYWWHFLRVNLHGFCWRLNWGNVQFHCKPMQLQPADMCPPRWLLLLSSPTVL